MTDVSVVSGLVKEIVLYLKNENDWLQLGDWISHSRLSTAAAIMIIFSIFHWHRKIFFVCC